MSNFYLDDPDFETWDHFTHWRPQGRGRGRWRGGWQGGNRGMGGWRGGWRGGNRGMGGWRGGGEGRNKKRGRRGSGRANVSEDYPEDSSSTTDSDTCSNTDTEEDDDSQSSQQKLTSQEIFDAIIKQHGGMISFDNFRAAFPQFKTLNRMVKFLYQQKRRFTLFRRGRKIVHMAAYKKNLSYCIEYIDNNCDGDSCSKFHICKYFLSGFCRYGDKCKLSHSFSDGHNKKVKKRLRLADYKDDELSVLLRCCYPQICLDSNACGNGEDCPYLHICHFYARGDCTRTNCRFSHDFHDDHNDWVLEAFEESVGELDDEDLGQAVPFLRPTSETFFEEFATTTESDTDSSTDTEDDDSQSLKRQLSGQEIFDAITRQHSGLISFGDFRTVFPQFTTSNAIVKFLYQQKRRFKLFKRGRKIVHIAAYKKNLSYCIEYIDNNCDGDFCSKFHICKYFLSGFCRYGDKCKLSHSFSDGHNKKVKKRLRLENYKDDELSVLLRCCYPQICLDANACGNGEDCPYLHICHFYARGNCTRSNCRFSHDFHDDHNDWVLEAFEEAVDYLDDEDLSQTIPFPRPKNLKTATSSIVQDIPPQTAVGNCASKSKIKSAFSQKSVPKLDSDEAGGTFLCHKHFVASGCMSSSLCGFHHNTSLRTPYLWQIKIQEEWKTMSQGTNEDTELRFCQLKTTSCATLEVGGRGKCSVTIDLNTLTGSYDNMIYPVRRLSTLSFVETSPGDSVGPITQWRWYFTDDKGKWKPYEKDAEQYTLEKKFLSKQKTYSFSRQGDQFRYKVNFDQMTQYNTATQRTRQLMRRPLFVSGEDVKEGKYVRSIFLPFIPDPPPPQWAPWDLSETDFELVELDEDHSEFSDVARSFYTTLEQTKFHIQSIERVQNRKLWNEYNTKKKNMEDANKHSGSGKRRHIDERNLFHGTDSGESCRGICTNSFDFRVSGKNATVYGEGSYFARDAKYSDAYASKSSGGERKMFQARVLVGMYTKGHKSYRRPPEIKGGCHKLYDSCVDNVMDPAIFVIFDRSQCYPEYLITYRLKVGKRIGRKFGSYSNLADASLKTAKSSNENYF